MCKQVVQGFYIEAIQMVDNNVLILMILAALLLQRLR